MIAKTLLSTLVQKKARFLGLIFSIASCASLLFANMGFQKTCKQMIYDADTRWCGNAEVYITAKQASGSQEWIDMGLLEPWSESLLYSYPVIKTNALYAPDSDGMLYFTVLGVDIAEFNSYNPLSLKEGNLGDWSGNRIIIGETYARMLGLPVGCRVKLEISGTLAECTVIGISEPKGLFLRELADGGYILMPRQALADITGYSCNLAFLKTNATISATQLRDQLRTGLPQYAVFLGIDHDMINAEIMNYVLPFWLSSILVVFMSIFIIYSSFNLIVNERIHIIGILRSVGSTCARAIRILALESVSIGAAGGAIGSVLGIGVLYAIKSVYFSGAAALDAVLAGQEAVMQVPMLFGLNEFLLTVLLSVLITLASAILPIISVMRTSVKDIILNDCQKQSFQKSKLWPVGALLALPSIIAPGIFGKGLTGMIAASVMATLALIGLNLFIPALCRALVAAMRHTPYELQLGARNVADYRALANNVRLFASVIALMAFMMSIFNTLATDLRSSYRREGYDISLVLRNTDDTSLGVLSNTPGVAGFCGAYESFAEIDGYNTFLNAVIGIDSIGYFEYSYAKIPEETLRALRALDEGKNIVTTNILREMLGLKVGDTLCVRMENGISEYKVTGFLDTNYGIGRVGYISSANYCADMGANSYTKILAIAEGDPAEAKRNIIRSLSGDVLSIMTKGELEAANADKVEGIFNAINSYAYFAMLIGFLGIANNMAASFLDRKRNIALYRCVGMASKSVARMLMAEAMAAGLTGCAAGLAVGIVMMREVPYVVGMLWGNVAVAAPVGKLALLCLSALSAMALSSLIPSIKGRNIPIMDNIRYE